MRKISFRLSNRFHHIFMKFRNRRQNLWKMLYMSDSAQAINHERPISVDLNAKTFSPVFVLEH
jgi:hypothetical protein